MIAAMPFYNIYIYIYIYIGLKTLKRKRKTKQQSYVVGGVHHGRDMACDPWLGLITAVTKPVVPLLGKLHGHYGHDIASGAHPPVSHDHDHMTGGDRHVCHGHG